MHVEYLTSANSLQISTPDWEGNWVWLWGGSVQSHSRANTDLRTAAAAAILSPSFPWRSPPADTRQCPGPSVLWLPGDLSFQLVGSSLKGGAVGMIPGIPQLHLGKCPGNSCCMLGYQYHFLRKHVYLSSHMGSQGEHAPEGEQGCPCATESSRSLEYECLDSIHKDSDLRGQEWDSNMGCFIKFSRLFFY